MARNYTVTPAVSRPAAAYASPEQVPTTLTPCDAFDPGTDESLWLIGVVPAEHTGLGTPKLRFKYCANTTTAADDARIDVVTEFRTPGAAEAANVANFDATPDSATITHATTAYAWMEATITLTPAVAPVAGDVFRIQVTRDANNGGGLDDLAVDLLIGRDQYEFYEEV